MRRIVTCLLAVALLVSASAKAAPPVQSVTVVNTGAQPVPTTIVNTPTVAISGTPTVNIANLPGGGTLYQEVLGVQFAGNGAVPGAPSSTVPAGKRRIITTISARYACPTGQRAAVTVFANIQILLPMQFTYTDSLGRDNYAMSGQFNFIMPEGAQMTPIIEKNVGGLCQADVFLSGVEVPDQP